MAFTDEQIRIINDDRSVKTIHLTITGISGDITADKVYQEDFAIEESLFEDEIKFGKCNSSIMKVKVADFEEDILGHYIMPFIVFTNNNQSVTVSMGVYIITNVERTSDRRWKIITAADKMSLFDVDIADWYNTTLYPDADTVKTVKQIRDALCSYLGVAQRTTTLIHDNLNIPKTINPDSLSARDLLQSICEINACFGHFDWNGYLKYVTLTPSGEESELLPSNSLYPSNVLLPTDQSLPPIEERVTVYKTCDYADYNTHIIDSVAILKEDGELATHADLENWSNRYIISGNILLYSFNDNMLRGIAENILANVKNITFVPNNTEAFSCIHMTMGQEYYVITRKVNGSQITNSHFTSFLTKRSIKGIQAIFSTLSATGSEYLPKTQTNDILSEMTIMKGKSAKYERDLEHLAVEFADYEEQTDAAIEVNANAISAEVTRATTAEGTLDSKITQTADSITSTVAAAQRTYDLSDYEGADIIYSFSNPTYSKYPPAEYSGKYLLNQSTGTLWRCNGTIWYAEAYLKTIDEELASEIKQTADSITITVSKNQTTWLEEHPVGTPIIIKYRDYKQPPTSLTADEMIIFFPDGVSVNDLYLDNSTGRVYKATSVSTDPTTYVTTITWSYNYTLEKREDHIISEINQSAEQIKISANKLNLVGYLTVEDVSATGTTVIDGGRIATNTLSADAIKVGELIVGDNVSMGPNASLSWNQITQQPTIPTNTNQLVNGAGYTTQIDVNSIITNTVTASFVNALNIIAGSVAAENITGTTISGKTISGATFSGGHGSIDYVNFKSIRICDVNNQQVSYIDENYGYFYTKQYLDLFARTAVGQPSYGFSIGATGSSPGIMVHGNLKMDSLCKGLYDASNNCFYVERYGNPNVAKFGNTTIDTRIHGASTITANHTITTSSDRRIKENFRTLEELENIFYELDPCSYTIKSKKNKTRNIGFIAQNVQDAFTEHNLDWKDYDFVTEMPVFDDYQEYIQDDVMYGLKYEEFIALNTHMIQKLYKRIEHLEGIINGRE